MLGLLSRIFWEGACNSNYSPFPRTPETWLLIQAQPPTYWEFWTTHITSQDPRSFI